MRLLLSLILVISVIQSHAQRKLFYGVSYAYGAAWNFHASNSQLFRPNDQSVLALQIGLSNGDKALGFQSAIGMRWNDFRYKIEDSYFIDNAMRSLEWKIFLTMPITRVSSISMGIAPRLVLRNSYNLVYESSSTGNHLESSQEIKPKSVELNALNSALTIGWLWNISKHFQFQCMIDQDIQPLYGSPLVLESYDTSRENEPEIKINGLITSVTAGIAFSLR